MGLQGPVREPKPVRCAGKLIAHTPRWTRASSVRAGRITNTMASRPTRKPWVNSERRSRGIGCVTSLQETEMRPSGSVESGLQFLHFGLRRLAG
jgi:hypothetical protein